MSNKETANKKTEAAKVPEVEVVNPPQPAQPRHAPLPDENDVIDEVLQGAEDNFGEEEGPMIDEGMVEHTAHQIFEIYQTTGNHEVRRLAKLVGQLCAAVLGADPREFFPDAPPIRDANAPGAPTFQGQPGQGWPAAHEAHGPQGGGGFQPTQPVMNANGQPAFQPLPLGVPSQGGQMHQANPSGAEMRVVNDPTGTMQSDGQMPPQYANQQQQFPRRRRRRG